MIGYDCAGFVLNVTQGALCHGIVWLALNPGRHPSFLLLGNKTNLNHRTAKKS